MFQQNNASFHEGTLRLDDLKYELFEQSLYSPDLASSDFYLLSKSKDTLGWTKFELKWRGDVAEN